MKSIPHKKIRLLYYSHALVANHGGRKHSEAFLAEAGKNPLVEKIIPYPSPKSTDIGNLNKDGKLKSALKSLPFAQVFSFYMMNLKSYRNIVSVIRKNDINVLHIRVTANFLIIRKLRKKFPQLLITTEVNASPFDEVYQDILRKKHFERLERESLQEADANFFVSSFLRKRIMGNYREARDFVVPNGVNLALFPPRPEKKEEEIFTFGYVGTIDFHKDLKILIDAFEQVKGKTSGRVQLLIIGDGPMMDTLRSYLESRGLQESVELLGWVEHTEIYSFLERMDVAIHHSAKKYMSPLKIFEYMAVGLPVIGPDIPALREILVDKEDILLVNPRVEDIAEKMALLMEQPSLRGNLARSGQTKIRANFSWKNNAEKILNPIAKKLEQTTAEGRGE